METLFSNNELSIQHFRLRSSRRKKRSQRLDFEKRLRKLHAEERAISRQIWNLGYEALDPPIQRGWKRSFVLRDDVAKGKDANFFQGILDKINTIQYSSKKDFKVKRRRRGKKIYVDREQELEQILPCAAEKKRLSEYEKKYFDLIMTDQKRRVWVYQFREPWRYKLKIEQNIIKWVKIKDFDLEKRRAEIRQYLDQNHLWPKMLKVVYGRYQWRQRYFWGGDLSKYKYDPLKNRSFADILNEYLPEEELCILKIENPRRSRVSFFCSMTALCFTFQKMVCIPVKYILRLETGRRDVWVTSNALKITVDMILRIKTYSKVAHNAPA